MSEAAALIAMVPGSMIPSIIFFIWNQLQVPLTLLAMDSLSLLLSMLPGDAGTDRLTRMRMGSVMNLLVISRISCGSVALIRTTCVAGGR